MKAKYIERSEFDAALAAAESDEHRAMLLASYGAGLRAMEIAALDWDMVLTASGIVAEDVTLPALATKGRTGAGTVPMSSELRQALARIHTARCFPRSGRIFARRGSSDITANAVALTLRKLYQVCGIKASSHSGRRAFATDLLRDGETLPDVRRVMRHSSITTTAIYLEPSAATRAAIERRAGK